MSAALAPLLTATYLVVAVGGVLTGSSSAQLAGLLILGMLAARAAARHGHVGVAIHRARPVRPVLRHRTG